MYGIIIGITIGAIVVFFICRELLCWYWKINKFVALMEEQNQYLKKIFIKFYNLKFDYVVKEDVNLRHNPALNSSVIRILSEGVYLTLLETGGNIEIEGTQANWVKVKTENDEIGWCFSGCLNQL